MDEEEVVVLPVDERRDPGGKLLAACLDAHLAYEHARATRKYLALSLIAVSAFVWVAAVWPATFSLGVRDGVLTAWAGLAMIVLGTYSRERYLRSKFDHEAARLDPESAFHQP